MLAAAATTAIIVLDALQPTLKLQNEDYTVGNPIGLAGVPDPEHGTLGSILVGLLAVCAVAALVSLVLRFRRAQGLERSSSSGSPTPQRWRSC